MKTLALCWIGVGDYNILFRDFYESFKAHFCNDCKKTFFVFTDKPFITFGLPDCMTYEISHACCNRAYVRFRKFFYLLLAEDQLLKHDYAAYMNGNMVCQKDVSSSEILPPGMKYAAVEHPFNMPLEVGKQYGPDGSAATFTPEAPFLYKQSGWIFCTAIEMLRMANSIEGWFRTDKACGKDIDVPMHDETYYNKYMLLHDKETVKLKGAEWLCPSCWTTASNAKMVQLDKKAVFAASSMQLEGNTSRDLYQMPQA